MSTNDKIKRYADHLAKAVEIGSGVAPLTTIDNELTLAEAYQVQLLTIGRQLEGGQRIVGKKIGLTSLAMQQLLNVDQPDYGHLMDHMVVENGGTISSTRVLQPKVEAEIAFVLKKDLVGPGITAEDVLAATDYVLPALEIVDSRIADWKIKLPDTVADNASSGLYVLGGKPKSVEQLDLTQVGMVLYKNGEIMNTGIGAAALGDPAVCVAWLANKLSEFGIVLKAGEVILSGALSAAINAEPGDFFHARFDQLGEVSVRFTS